MSEATPLEVNAQLEFEDFYKVLWRQTFKRLWLVYIAALFTMFMWGLSLLTGVLKFAPIQVLGQIPLIAVILLQWAIYSGAKRNAATVKGPTQWSFSDAGYKAVNPIAKSESTWEGIVQIEEMKDYFSLYVQKNVSVIIAKKGFQDSEKIEEFRRLVRQQLGNKAKFSDRN